jgi:hypothetical protein
MIQLIDRQVVVGTAQEIAQYLQSADLGDEQLTLLVPVKDYSDFFPNPPVTIRDKVHLEELLLEGLCSSDEEVTEQDWIDIRREVRERLAARNQQP